MKKTASTLNPMLDKVLTILITSAILWVMFSLTWLLASFICTLTIC